MQIPMDFMFGSQRYINPISKGPLINPLTPKIGFQEQFLPTPELNMGALVNPMGEFPRQQEGYDVGGIPIEQEGFDMLPEFLKSRPKMSEQPSLDEYVKGNTEKGTYYQHKLRKGTDIEKIKTEGFKGGIGPNALPALDFKIDDIMDAKFGAKKGDLFLLVPQQWIKNTPNGSKVKDGYIPKKSDIVTVTEDGQLPFELRKSQLTAEYNAKYGKQDGTRVY